jgi:hypothetical protein
MSKEAAPFTLGEVARVVTDGPVDYKALFEEEHRKRRQLEGQLSSAMHKLREGINARTDLEQNAIKASRLNARIDDARRGLAARLLAALVIREGISQEEMFDQACRAVDLADELMGALLVTKPPKPPKLADVRASR